MAVRTIRKESPSDEEMRHAERSLTELDGTGFSTRITERLTDEAMSERIAKAMAVFVDTVNMTVTQQKEKVFVIPRQHRGVRLPKLCITTKEWK